MILQGKILFCIEETSSRFAVVIKRIVLYLQLGLEVLMKTAVMFQHLYIASADVKPNENIEETTLLVCTTAEETTFINDQSVGNWKAEDIVEVKVSS